MFNTILKSFHQTVNPVLDTDLKLKKLNTKSKKKSVRNKNFITT